MLSIYTGKGKGKTTAAIGAAIRALGAKKTVLFCQFLKTGTSSELNILKSLDGLKAKTFGREGFYLPKEKLKESSKLKEKAEPLTSVDKDKAEAGLEWLKSKLKEKKVDLVILDEINLAVSFGLLEAKEVLSLVSDSHLEFIFTGRQAPDEFLSRADLVTKCKDKKHYYYKGEEGKQGREY